MKRAIILPLAGLAFGIWACGSDDDNTVSTSTCATQEQCIQDAIREIYGEGVNVDSLLAANPSALDSILQVYTPMSSSAIGSSGDIFVNPGEDIVVHPGDDNGTPSSADGTNPLSSADTTSPASSGNDTTPASSAVNPTSSAGGSNPASSDSDKPASSSGEIVPGTTPTTPTTPASSAVEPVASSDFKEDYRDECTIGDIPSSVNNEKLPDPFKGLDGKRISTKAEWKCRREEIGAMYEKLMFGEKPRNPEKVEGSISGKTFTVKVTDKGKSVSFTVEINNAGTKDKPKPAMIGFGGGMFGGGCGSLGNSINGLDIATIVFDPDNVAPESGGGKFFDLYSGSKAGTIIAWAWGVSRVIDALENTPEAGIDVHHLGMTGCSRWGKGTLAVGAFDTRIALTVPQESGSGGASLWRVGAQVNKQKGKQFVQGLQSAGTEGKWMISSFQNYNGKENTLPFDQHMLVGMVAPRALLILDNAGQEWLGEVPSNYCGQASKEIYDALGATANYTYSQEGGHSHCQLPNGQFDEVKDFINKFLLGQDAQTGKIDFSKNTEKINWNKSDWIDWETPTLN